MYVRRFSPIIHECLIISLLLLQVNFLKAQGFVHEVDLGIVNAELGVVVREIELQGNYQEKQLVTSSENLSVVRIHRKDKPVLTEVQLMIELNEQLGIQKDTLFIYSDDSVLLSQYVISYQVLAQVGDVFKSYRNEFWPFKSKSQVFNLKTAKAGDSLVAYFDLLNFGGETLDLSEVTIADSLKVEFYPSLVPHNSFTRMKLSYFSNESSPLGFNRVKLPILSGSDTLSFLPIQYSLLPPKVRKGGQISVLRDEFDYKTVSEGDMISEVVLISNAGHEELVIFKVESNCKCLETSLSNTNIAPEQNAQLRFNFNTSGRGGLERKVISLFTNDPQTPVKNIVIKAHVK